jgi:hypothetical protein
MPTKKTPAERIRERIDDLQLPSLEENRLEGYAYLFRIVLPLFDAAAKKWLRLFLRPRPKSLVNPARQLSIAQKGAHTRKPQRKEPQINAERRRSD